MSSLQAQQKQGFDKIGHLIANMGNMGNNGCDGAGGAAPTDVTPGPERDAGPVGMPLPPDNSGNEK
eukprot:10712461-Karenia_brevis.AAC.1